MSVAEQIESIQAKFREGVSVVVLETPTPERTRGSLWKAAKVRGLRWKFAVLNDAVVVKRKLK